MGANRVPLLVFGSKDRDDSVYAVNANTGARVWRYQTSTAADSDVGAPPTISARGRNGFANGVVYVTGKDKIVYALNLATGALIWKHALAKGTNGDVAGASLVGDRVYVNSDTGVYALNATTGAQIWHALSQATFFDSPAVTGPVGRQVLVAASTEGSMYALSLADRRDPVDAEARQERLLGLPGCLAGRLLHIGPGWRAPGHRTPFLTG